MGSCIFRDTYTVPSKPSNSSSRVFVIAELAQSYEGSFCDAQQLVRAAAAAGADAVKFQIFRADELAVPEDEDLQDGRLCAFAQTLLLKHGAHDPGAGDFLSNLAVDLPERLRGVRVKSARPIGQGPLETIHRRAGR